LEGAGSKFGGRCARDSLLEYRSPCQDVSQTTSKDRSLLWSFKTSCEQSRQLKK